MLGLNSESGSGLGLQLECIQYIKLLIQYTINWVAISIWHLGTTVLSVFVRYTTVIELTSSCFVHFITYHQRDIIVLVQIFRHCRIR